MIQDKKARGLAVVLIIFMLGIILVSSFASAGFFDYLKNKLTGKATSQTFQVNLTVGNTAPEFSTLRKNHTGTEYVIESQGITVTYIAHVDDADGVDNIDITTLEVNITNGTIIKSNDSCHNTNNLTGTRMNFTCNFTVNYWETGTTWTVNGSVHDLSSTAANNDTETFTLGETTAFTIDQTEITFPSPTPGSANVQTTNSPSLILNNTANDPIEAGKVFINATTLLGAQDQGYFIDADNFTAYWDGTGTTECTSGTNLQNITNVSIPIVNITTGDQTNDEGFEEVWLCLENVYSGLISQEYSTQAPTAAGPWQLHITQ